MDKIGDLAHAIDQLRAAGQTGFWIIALVLIAAAVLLTAAFLIQRVVISRHEQILKSIETNIKSTESNIKTVEANIKSVETTIKERELGVKERDELRAIFNQQFTVVKDTNEELRSEMSRLRDQQKGIKDSINHTITEGLRDIRERISQTSVKEIVSQIPDSFRQELANEFQNALHASSEKLRVQLEGPVFESHINAAIKEIIGHFDEHFTERLEKRIGVMISRNLEHRLPHEILEYIYHSLRRHTDDSIASRVMRDLAEDYRYWRRFP